MYKFLLLLLFLVQLIYAGKIEGTVSYAGSNKTPKSLKMDSDPICGASHNIPPLKEDFILDKDNNFKDVIVWIKNITYEGENNSSSHTINQKGCLYSPHVNVVNPGQKVLIKNSDKTLHNVNSQSKVNDTFNSAQPAGVPDIEKIFSTAEEPFYIKCDVHPWMKAWVMVSEHPYFSITDSNGKYEINNVPPGTYELFFWQEKLSNLPKKKYVIPSNMVSITVKRDDTTTTQDFVFQKPVKKRNKTV